MMATAVATRIKRTTRNQRILQMTKKKKKTRMKFARTPRSSLGIISRRIARNSLKSRSRKRERRKLAKNSGNFVRRRAANANKPAGEHNAIATRRGRVSRKHPFLIFLVVVEEG